MQPAGGQTPWPDEPVVQQQLPPPETQTIPGSV